MSAMVAVDCCGMLAAAFELMSGLLEWIAEILWRRDHNDKSLEREPRRADSHVDQPAHPTPLQSSSSTKPRRSS